MGVRICLGCLNEVTDQSQRCPRCGFSLADPVAVGMLIPKTLLKGRYVVGKAYFVDGEGISYAGYDVQTNTAVAVREYMPGVIAVRNGAEVTPTTGATAKYKALKSDFMELHKHLIQWNSTACIRKVYDVFEQNNTVYAVGEYFNAITLSQYLNDNAGELDWNIAGNMFRTLIENLSLVNKSGFIHRGVSPDSIEVMADGSLKLTEFSICSARVKNSEIECSLAEGYAAPEQYSTAPHGQWTDVYGVCAVLYRTLTGTRPPSAPTRQVNDNLTYPNTLNTTIPSHISNAIMAGLAFETTERTQSLDELINNLYNSIGRTAMFEAAGAANPLFDPYATRGGYDTGYNTGYNDAPQYEDDEEAGGKKKGFFDQFFEDGGEEPEQDNAGKNAGKNGKKIKWDENYADDFKAKDKNGKDNKTPRPIWLKILLCSLPVIFIVFILLYQSMIGFSFFGGGKDKDKKPNKTSKASSSQVSSAASSSKASSAPPVSTAPPSQAEKPKQTAMINMVGMYSEVIAEYSATFRFTEPRYEYNEQYLTGQICAQTVPEGTMLNEGDTVTLTISKGSQYVILPSYIGLKPEQYVEKLKELGISATVEKEYSSDVFEGYITRSTPEAGSSMDRTAAGAVLVYVSKGMEPAPSKPEPKPESKPTSKPESNPKPQNNPTRD